MQQIVSPVKQNSPQYTNASGFGWTAKLFSLKDNWNLVPQNMIQMLYLSN